MIQLGAAIKDYFELQTYGSPAGLAVSTCGHWATDDHVLLDRTRTDWLLIYCVGGNGTFVSGRKQFAISKGQIFAALPNIEHGYWCGDGGWDIWFVHFAGDITKKLIDWIGFTEMSPVLELGKRNDIIVTFEQMYSVAEQKKLNYEITSAGFLYQLLLQIKTAAVSSEMERSGLEKALASPADSVEQMARYAGMSKYHFIREFKKTTGQTPWQYITASKITKAKELLANPEYSIKQIAFELGFKDPNYFSRLFRKHTGTTASEFRGNLIG